MSLSYVISTSSSYLSTPGCGGTSIPWLPLSFKSTNVFKAWTPRPKKPPERTALQVTTAEKTRKALEARKATLKDRELVGEEGAEKSRLWRTIKHFF